MFRKHSANLELGFFSDTVLLIIVSAVQIKEEICVRKQCEKHLSKKK